MKYKTLLSSNSKIFTIYFIGVFLALLLANILQHTASKITNFSFPTYQKYENVELTQKSNKTSKVESILTREFPQKQFIVKHGDSFAKILSNAGIVRNETEQIITSIKSLINPKKIKIGSVIIVDFNINKLVLGKPWVNGLEIKINNNKKIKIIRDAASKFVAQEIKVPLIRKIMRKTGTINNSFIATAIELSVPHQAIQEMVKAYSYDVDFQRELKSGNKLDVVMDRYYTEEGKFSHNGNVLYASLQLENKMVKIYQFTNKNGDFSYFNEKGLSVKKELLRTPINAAKITSGFGRRMHPVHGYSRMHKGVDFAAPIGTPILAAGAGTIEEIGFKGGYGKYIKVKHTGSYSTAYAHASNFAKGLKKGFKVKQGQVIAYVGTTGVSTGPHLHYEVIINGKQTNPLKVKLSSDIRLIGADLKNFNDLKNHVNKLILKLPPKSEILAKEVAKL